MLFSGGLDSLSGAIEELAFSTKKLRWSAIGPHLRFSIIRSSSSPGFKQRFPNSSCTFRYWYQAGAASGSEYTQRSRSFLYTALACVVAQLFGNDRIRFFENGVVSINLPISEHVVGARATRTTHPLVLERFREFFSAAVGRPIEMDNPFLWKTKADVIGSIVEQEYGRLSNIP